MYFFYLDKVRFPVTPSKLQLKIDNKNKTMTLINDGEVNILKDPGLTKISFGLLLPNVRYDDAKFATLQSGTYHAAKWYLNKLEKWKLSKEPIKFVVLRYADWSKRNLRRVSHFDTRMKVSLEDYTITEDADKYGTDVYVDVTLRQYKPFKTKTVTFKKKKKKSKNTKKKATAKTTRDSTKGSSATTYTVKKGDCLWNIAKKFLGNGTRNKEIYKLNKDVIEKTAKKYGFKSSSNGWWIFPGTKLKIPKK